VEEILLLQSLTTGQAEGDNLDIIYITLTMLGLLRPKISFQALPLGPMGLSIWKYAYVVSNTGF
jgi:hypothetical protein